jgi:hypothetical protein
MTQTGGLLLTLLEAIRRVPVTPGCDYLASTLFTGLLWAVVGGASGGQLTWMARGVS